MIICVQHGLGLTQDREVAVREHTACMRDHPFDFQSDAGRLYLLTRERMHNRQWSNGMCGAQRLRNASLVCISKFSSADEGRWFCEPCEIIATLVASMAPVER